MHDDLMDGACGVVANGAHQDRCGYGPRWLNNGPDPEWDQAFFVALFYSLATIYFYAVSSSVRATLEIECRHLTCWQIVFQQLCGLCSRLDKSLPTLGRGKCPLGLDSPLG